MGQARRESSKYASYIFCTSPLFLDRPLPWSCAWPCRLVAFAIGLCGQEAQGSYWICCIAANESNPSVVSDSRTWLRPACSHSAPQSPKVLPCRLSRVKRQKPCDCFPDACGRGT